MKLSMKDKEFLERLRELMDEGSLWIERRMDFPSRFILHGNYGEHIERRFGMTRQGVRWRFQRLFNGIYVEAYEVVIFLEKLIGNDHRHDALAIAHDRFEARRRMLEEIDFMEANRYRGSDKD